MTVGLDKICLIRPPLQHGRGKRFLEGPEGKILLEFIHQQKKWLYENGVQLIQVHAPVGITRVAKLYGDRKVREFEKRDKTEEDTSWDTDGQVFEEHIMGRHDEIFGHGIDVTLREVLSPHKCQGGLGSYPDSDTLEGLQGIPYKDVLLQKYGFSVVGKLRVVDAIMFSKRGVVVTEVKTDLTWASAYDRGVGQVTIYREAFIEDYPLIANEVPVYALLVGERCGDFKFIEPTLKRSGISLYDVTAGEFLTAKPFYTHAVKSLEPEPTRQRVRG